MVETILFHISEKDINPWCIISQNGHTHTSKIFQQMLQDFYIVPDHFGTLCIKGLIDIILNINYLPNLPTCI